jgi:hypothetical protein
MTVPAVNALGSVALLLFGDSIVAKLLLTSGSLGLVLLFGLMLRLHPSRDVCIMTTGAISSLAGKRLWLVGERLELSRVRL